MKANQDIRIKACEMGVHYWEIAKWLGIRPETFSRLLREELNPQQKEKVMRAIYEISYPIGHGTDAGRLEVSYDTIYNLHGKNHRRETEYCVPQ